MSIYYYLEVELKLRDDTGVVLTEAFFQGSIEESLQSFFGEIGGDTDLQLLKFNSEQKRAVLRVGEEYYQRVHAAITLIGHFQDIPCHFQVNKTSTEPLEL